tara:strand:- start:5039 stop:5515 length:477 start_codon:yes stop_codon:yes gene_type:complete
MRLLLRPDNDNIKKYYDNHSTFNEGDSGLDLFFHEDKLIKSGKTLFIDFGIKCEMEQVSTSWDSDSEPLPNLSYYLYPRSSISKTPLRMANSVGIIDAGYRGNIIAAVDNTSSEDYLIKAGQRLFQICSATLQPFDLIVVEELSLSDRGTGGFGSTDS